VKTVSRRVGLAKCWRGEVLVGRSSTSLGGVEPSKPTEPPSDQPPSIPQPRHEPEAPLVGEVIPKGVPLARPTFNAQPQGAVGPVPPRKGTRLRTVLIVLVAVAAAVCLGGLGAGYLLYHKATEPDRSSPTVVLEQYLNAKFSTRDDVRARSLECGSPNLGAIDAMLADLQAREQSYGITIQVSSADLNLVVTGDKATIGANLKISVPEANGGTSRSVQPWQFSLENAGGWRMCGAHQVG
jgi:hypothetical protein